MRDFEKLVAVALGAGALSSMCVASKIADSCEIDESLLNSSVGVGAVDSDGGTGASCVGAVSGGAGVPVGAAADCTWQGR